MHRDRIVSASGLTCCIKSRLLDYWGFLKNPNAYVYILTVIVLGVCDWRSIRFQSWIVKKNADSAFVYTALHCMGVYVWFWRGWSDKWSVLKWNRMCRIKFILNIVTGFSGYIVKEVKEEVEQITSPMKNCTLGIDIRAREILIWPSGFEIKLQSSTDNWRKFSVIATYFAPCSYGI